MDLSAADIRHLNLVRERSRFTRPIMAVIATLALVSAVFAVWGGLTAAGLAEFQNENLSFQRRLLSVHVFYGRMGIVGFLGLSSLIYGALLFILWHQRRCDALILKLVGQLSGYPDRT